MTQDTKTSDSSPERTPADVNSSFLTGLVNQSSKLDKLATALSRAQGEITGARKTSKNPYFKSDYADLYEVLEATRPILSKHGLSIVQTTDGVEVIGSTAFLNVGTTLMHTSGQWIRSYTPLPVESPVNCHKLGSALTYGRRYGLAAMVGIAQMDDDGNAAIDKGVGRKPKPPIKAPNPTVKKVSPVDPTHITSQVNKLVQPVNEPTIIDGGSV